MFPCESLLWTTKTFASSATFKLTFKSLSISKMAVLEITPFSDGWARNRKPWEAGRKKPFVSVSQWVCLCPHLLFVWFSLTASVSLVRLYGFLSICLCHRLLCLFHLDGSVKSLYFTSNIGYLCLPSRVISLSLRLKSLHFFFLFLF